MINKEGERVWLIKEKVDMSCKLLQNITLVT